MVMAAVIGIALQLLGYYGVVAAEERKREQKPPLRMPPPFLGSLLLHGLATLGLIYVSRRISNSRTWRFVASTSCFAFSFCGDVAFIFCGLFSKHLGEFAFSHGPLYLVSNLSDPYCIDSP